MNNNYDYLSRMENDILDYISENVDLDEYPDRESLSEYLNMVLDDSLNDKLYHENRFTYNDCCLGAIEEDETASYDYVSSNWKLLAEALDYFECYDAFGKTPKWYDLTIQLYLLPDAIQKTVDSLDM